MALKLDCPHCKRPLNVTEKAFGQTVPCPACNQPITVPREAGSRTSPRPLGAPAQAARGLAPEPDINRVSTATNPSGMPPMPDGMPPMPEEDKASAPAGTPWAFLQAAGAAGRPRSAADGYAAGLSQERQDATLGGIEAARSKRPLGIVWLVFYWVFGGVLLMLMGLSLQFAGGAAAGALAEIGSRGGVGAAVGVELLSLLGLLGFHVGLLMLVTCYGLWTFRKWGLSMAKVLAAVSAVMGLIGLIAALVTRGLIAVSLANALISAAIVVYLFGSTNLSEQAQRYIAQIRSRTTTPDWKEFE